MTSRARKMLAAYRDGARTRHELWRAAGDFFLTNNAASELRREGFTVNFDRKHDSYKIEAAA